jgi:hypothetical protein
MSNVSNILNGLFGPGAAEPSMAPAARSGAKQVNGAPSPFENALRQATDKGSARAQQDPQASASPQGQETVKAPVAPKETPCAVKPEPVQGSRAEVFVKKTAVVGETVLISPEAQSLERGIEELTRLLRALTQMPAEQGADLLVSITDGAIPKDQALAFVKALQDIWRGMGPSGPAVLQSPDFALGLLDRVQDDLATNLSDLKQASLPVIAALILPGAPSDGAAAALDTPALQDVNIAVSTSSRSATTAQTIALQAERFMSALDLYAQRGLPSLNDGSGTTGEAILVPSDWKIQLAPSDGVPGEKPSQALKALMELMAETRAGRVLLTQTVAHDFQARIQEATAAHQNLASVLSPAGKAALETPAARTEDSSQFGQKIQKALEALQAVIREVRQALLGKTSETPAAPAPSEPVPASVQRVLDTFRQEARIAVENQAKTQQAPSEVIVVPVAPDVKLAGVNTRNGSQLVEASTTGVQDANVATRQVPVLTGQQNPTKVEPQVNTGDSAGTHGEPNRETGLLSQPKVSVAGHASTMPAGREIAPAPVDPAQVIQQVAKEVSLQMLRSSTVTRLSFQLVPENSPQPGGIADRSAPGSRSRRGRKSSGTVLSIPAGRLFLSVQ